MTQPAPVTLEEHLAAQQHEYGQYVAAQPINHNGVRAYNTGDPVPASNVEAHGYLAAGLVVKAGSDGVSPNATTDEQLAAVEKANAAEAKKSAAKTTEKG